jgi:hypothetical protein
MTMLIASCGGSGSGAPAVSAASTTIAGSVFAAPVAGATVVVLNSSGTTTIAGPVSTADDGTYSVNIPNAELTNDLVISSNSGTFTDEASGAQTLAGTMFAYVEAGTLSAGSKVTLDPSSTITHKLVTAHGKTAAAAKTAFGNGFGFMPDTAITPELCTCPLSGTDAAPRLRGLVAAALSQLTQDIGLAPEQQFDLLTALAEDISDGKLDGMNAASPVTVPGTAVVVPANILTRYYQAVDNASRTAFTSTYKVEYLPDMMAAAQGKTTFKIKITKRSDSSAAPGLTLSLMPIMRMLTMNHATPVDDIVDNGDGTYSCTVYYLMSPVMGGMAMGYWEFEVVIGSGMMGEATTFYPYVGMAMSSDTVRATLYGPDDIVSGMSGTQYNKYYLFRDGAVTVVASTLKLFISHGEDMNMNFVSVSGGSMLSSPTGTVTSMTIQASTDSAFTTPLTAVDNGGGHWSVSGLSGLVSAQTTTIYVKQSVNGQEKTTNGAAASGANSYATFIVTPQ